MKLCRFGQDRIGLVTGDEVCDVSAALNALPALRYPFPPGDQMIAELERLKLAMMEEARRGERHKVGDVTLLAPVANPNKLIAAPINYQSHIDQDVAGSDFAHNHEVTSITRAGLFLKANSSLTGAGHGVCIAFPDRRNDHELELAVIIGTQGKDIAEDAALSHVAGYCIGLDMTVRGPEDRSFRKSADGYSVLGPWMVSADEIADPDTLDLELSVNGEPRQKTNTRELVLSVPKLIAWASSVYTLYPGDVIFTGTPAGVAPVKPGDIITATAQDIGTMEVAVRG
jgi:2-keto-4-pentenoate hydratase/2-oxohepta-3-ene-1,7-dioic acid hydratase in catechol pathway